MNKEKLVEISHVDAGYSRELVLRNVSLDIYAGDFIGVIGPNGGGKTTLVKVILGLLEPLRGTVKYHMQTTNDKPDIGYLPQMNTIDRKFPISVEQVVLSGFMNQKRMIRKFSREERQNALQILEEMRISTLRKKAIGELSGGQMQRVFLARAIVSSPKLLILDEPNSFVDNTFESELYEKLRNLNKSMAIVIVSHDMGMISSSVKAIACVNKELHYHRSNIITEEQLKEYNCPIQLITHGDIPHTVLEHHDHS